MLEGIIVDSISAAVVYQEIKCIYIWLKGGINQGKFLIFKSSSSDLVRVL